VFAIIIADFQFVRLSETWRTVTEDCECFIMVLITIGGYVKLFIVILKNKNVRFRELQSFI